MKKLGLKVNATKTHIGKPTKLKYLGFGFWKFKDEWRARPHEDSVAKFKRAIKKLKLPNELLPMKEIFFDRTAQFKLRELSAF